MSKYNLHVTSVPDHKAQMVLARIIVGSDSMISIQQAVEMTAKPPLLLFHNLERKDLKPHTDNLTSLGVKFNLSEVQETLDISEMNFGGHREIPDYEQEQEPPEKPPKRPTRLRLPEKPKTKKLAPVQATEREYRKQQTRGYRIGAIDADAMKAAETASRKKSLAVTSVIVAALLLIGVLMFHIPQGNNFTAERAPGRQKNNPEKKAAPSKTKSGGNFRQNAADAEPPDSAARPEGEPRVQATPQQRQESNALVDSAKAGSESDLKKSVVFYKMAISFNRHNLAAWQGLLQAYRELHMQSEAAETERQMREIFGSETLSVVNIVKSYGELVDIYVNDDNVHMVEYRTSKTSKVDILRDVFTLTRAVRAACACQNISVHAAAGAGKGVTARSTQHTSVHSLSEFMRQAEIAWLE